VSEDFDAPERTVWQGRYLAARTRGRWEYVARARGIRAAVILAIDGDAVLLVEQYRVPLGRNCLELPAGLIGDETANEPAEVAAARELKEETGYHAARMVPLGEFHSSPGMTSESFTLLRAEGLEKVGPGGGVEGENITVHRVPLGGLPEFVAARRAEGCAIDVKLLVLLSRELLPQAARPRD